MLMKLYDNKYVYNNEFEKVGNDEQIVYINYDKAAWLRTDNIGDSIINECNGEKPLQQIFCDLSNKFGISSDLLIESCDEFIKKIIDLRLVYNVNEEKYQDVELDEEEKDIYPNSIWIHVTGRCNLSCDFCYSKSGIDNSNSLEVEDVIEFLSKIPVEKRREIILSGGEPFMYKDIVELIKRLKCELNFKDVRVISNGTVGNEKYKEVAEYIDSIQFSVDGPFEEIHEISRGKGSYKRLLESLEVAREAKIKYIVISFTPTINNIDYLKDMCNFAYDHNIDSLHITKLMPVGRGQVNNEKLELTREKYDKALDEFYAEYIRTLERIKMHREIYEVGVLEENKRRYLEVTMAGDISAKVRSIGRKLSCGVGANIISINYDGYIYACPSLHIAGYKLGSLKDKVEDIMTVGININYDLSVENEKSDCFKCKYKYFCGGGCKAVSLAKNGVYLENEECDKQRDNLNRTIFTINIG